MASAFDALAVHQAKQVSCGYDWTRGTQKVPSRSDRETKMYAEASHTVSERSTTTRTKKSNSFRKGQGQAPERLILHLGKKMRDGKGVPRNRKEMMRTRVRPCTATGSGATRIIARRERCTRPITSDCSENCTRPRCYHEFDRDVSYASSGFLWSSLYLTRGAAS